jgi:hypothetical protein
MNPGNQLPCTSSSLFLLTKAYRISVQPAYNFTKIIVNMQSQELLVISAALSKLLIEKLPHRLVLVQFNRFAVFSEYLHTIKIETHDKAVRNN